MSNVIHMPDGFGRTLDSRSPMLARPGSHVAYARGSDLVVEWYDFGDHAPYESANLIIFDRETQVKLAELMGVDPALTPHGLSTRVAAKFRSYFDVKQLAEGHGLPF